jgi:uncharacterized membrane protein YqhA
MFRFLLSLRYLMLFASAGAMFGALLMFWAAGAQLVTGTESALAGEAGKAITASVLAATDKLLFGIVLVIFAYAITFGFMIEVPDETWKRMPAWMRVSGVSELKHTLVEVVLVYLIVDFATDLAEDDTHVSWPTLVMPISIVLIAAALRLLGTDRREPARSDRSPHGRTSLDES